MKYLAYQDLKPKALHHSGFICFADLFFAKQQIEGSDIVQKLDLMEKNMLSVMYIHTYRQYAAILHWPG